MIGQFWDHIILTNSKGFGQSMIQKPSKIYFFVFMCLYVSACVRACMRACVPACVCEKKIILSTQGAHKAFGCGDFAQADSTSSGIWKTLSPSCGLQGIVGTQTHRYIHNSQTYNMHSVILLILSLLKVSCYTLINS